MIQIRFHSDLLDWMDEHRGDKSRSAFIVHTLYSLMKAGSTNAPTEQNRKTD